MTDTAALTPEQDAFLEEMLDDLLGTAETIRGRAEELGVDASSPALSREAKATKSELSFIVRASLREKFLPEVAAMSSDELEERRQAVRNVAARLDGALETSL